MINPYEFLGLTRSECTLAELKTAYYRLALICHPDKGGDPNAMKTLILSYQWVLQQLTAANEHQKTFDEYYGEDTKQTTHIPSFTDVLAETFEYTLPRFQTLCFLHTITEPDIQKMLFIPAFEWAMTKKATPDNLDNHLHTFLETYIRITQTPMDSIEYYVPMSDANGYGACIEAGPFEFLAHKEKYQQHVASNMILYKEPVSMDAPIKASIIAESSLNGFTNIAAPLPVYDYEEAFTTYYIPGSEAPDTETPLNLLEARDIKEMERRFQDQDFTI